MARYLKDSVSKIGKNLNMICTVCGANLYPTRHGLDSISFHCSSEKARFWDFERGTRELIESKRHWDMSKKELVMSTH